MKQVELGHTFLNFKTNNSQFQFVSQFFSEPRETILEVQQLKALRGKVNTIRAPTCYSFNWRKLVYQWGTITLRSFLQVELFSAYRGGAECLQRWIKVLPNDRWACKMCIALVKSKRNFRNCCQQNVHCCAFAFFQTNLGKGSIKNPSSFFY